MKALFVANVHLESNEGIYKKIIAEATALGNVIGECSLVLGEANSQNSRVYDVISGIEKKNEGSILSTAIKLIEQDRYSHLYIRLMIPNFKLIKLMKNAKKRNTKVFYEIPTYPFYAEQIRTSRKKHRAVVKVTLDAIFSPLVYKYCDIMPVIRSNSHIKLKKKMIEITNGVNTDTLKEKTYPSKNDGIFRMVTVGTLYPYHGYDRVLQGLMECNEEINGTPIEFHVVGHSQTIDDLEEKANSLGLRRVFFHGTKTTEELNEMYESFDVGLGCLALHRRNADIDTTLKVIEYYCRGVPVVTSGKSPYFDPQVTITVPDNEAPININEIFEQWKAVPSESIHLLSKKAKEVFDWNNVFAILFKKIIKETNNEVEK